MSRLPSMVEGEVLGGKFRVERVLGVGGMGVVLAATHLQLDQLVALKFVVPGTSPGTAALERFQREARAAARLKSEHVARVLDVGTLPPTGNAPGAPYIVMEYLEGHDLGSYLHGVGGRFPIADACDYVLQACEAIAEAHAIGIVHRDLKPTNLFVTTALDGRPFVKVLDFGISKLVTPEAEALSLTKTAEVIGSPNYMSPEQLRSSREVDARTDVWSLGVILYELLTGTVPFPAETITQLTAKVLQDPPVPLRSLRLDVPPPLEALVYRCLEKDRARRFSSVAELARALEPFAGGRAAGAASRIAMVLATRGPPSASPFSDTSPFVHEPTSPLPPEPSAPRRPLARRFAVGLALAIALAAGAVYALRRGPPEAESPTPTSSSAAAPVTPLASPPPSDAPPSVPPSPAAPALSIPAPSPSIRVAPPPRPRPHASAVPSAAPPSDEMPSERH